MNFHENAPHTHTNSALQCPYESKGNPTYTLAFPAIMSFASSVRDRYRIGRMIRRIRFRKTGNTQLQFIDKNKTMSIRKKKFTDNFYMLN